MMKSVSVSMLKKLFLLPSCYTDISLGIELIVVCLFSFEYFKELALYLLDCIVLTKKKKSADMLIFILLYVAIFPPFPRLFSRFFSLSLV